MDTAENMIVLNPWLHKLWGKPYIGFQPFEKLDNGGVRATLRYLKRNLPFKTVLDPDILKDAVKDPNDLLKAPQLGWGILVIRDSKTARPILDGYITGPKPCIGKGKEVKAPDLDIWGC